MKEIWKYILVGLGIAFIYLLWVAYFPAFFNGMTWEVASIVGTGFFLSFEMVVLVGVILLKLKKK